MSNNNKFWGKRYGYTTSNGGTWLVVRSYGSPSGNSGKGNNTAATAQSKADKKAFEDFVKKTGGRPVITYNWKGKRIA